MVGLTEVSIRKLKVNELKAELSKRGLAVKGKKDDLVNRLLEAIEDEEEEEVVDEVVGTVDGQEEEAEEQDEPMEDDGPDASQETSQEEAEELSEQHPLPIEEEKEVSNSSCDVGMFYVST